MTLIYNCINVKFCKSDALIGLSLNILLNCIKNLIFCNKFIETNGISRICSVPNFISSRSISTNILLKLSKRCSLMKNVFDLDYIKMVENNNNMAIRIMSYAIRSYPTSHHYHGVAFIINSFLYKNFYDIFINQGGIKEFYSRIRESIWFRELKNPQTNSKNCFNNIYNIHKIFIKYSIRLLLIHLIRQIRLNILQNIYNYLPPFNL
ncbi:hypothetical protein HZS_7552 [Henneguya salminicola]|nr:hypothetical protein HZS_7552 [Henneguya salminicola]